MAPHRDELAAAYERVAALEARVDELEAPATDASAKESTDTIAEAKPNKTLGKQKSGKSESANTWTSGAPTTKDVVVGLLGGIVVFLLAMGFNVWQFSRIDLGRPATKSFMSNPVVFLTSLVAVAGLAGCLPRAFIPVTFMSTKDEWGNWSPGFQFSKGRWAALAAVFAVINALLFAVGPRFF